MSAKSKKRPAGANNHAVTLASLGVVGLLVPVAAGRWGSYISVPGLPIYLADVLVALGVVGMIAFRLRRDFDSSELTRTPVSLIIGSSTLALFIAVCLLLGNWQGGILVIRDLIPLAYLALTPVFFQIVSLVGVRKVFRWLSIACALHTVWFAAAVLRILPPVSLGPFSSVPAFTTRGDFDLLIAGLSVAVFLLNKDLSGWLKAPLSTLAAVSLFAGGSRAGLISGLVLLVLTFVVGRARSSRVSAKLVAALSFSVALLVPTSLAVLSNPPEWMRGISRIFDVGSAEQTTAQNTWGARLYAWDRVLEYTNADPLRSLFGSGPGSQPILRSAAVAFLSGDPSVRAAHNFIVTWFAFFGSIGLILILTVLLLWYLTGFRIAARNRDVSGLGFALATSLFLAALGGVIIESPFGYMLLVLGIVLMYSPAPFSAYGESRRISGEQSQRPVREVLGH